jgi:hypothetical protein
MKERFEQLRRETTKAARLTFSVYRQQYSNEAFYAFALYTDDGAGGANPAANTEQSLKRKTKKYIDGGYAVPEPGHLRYVPDEWAYSGAKGSIEEWVKVWKMNRALYDDDSIPFRRYKQQAEGFRPPDVAAEPRFLLRVAWGEQTAAAAARIWLAEQPKPIIERAAVALAALAFGRLIPNGRMRVTAQGQRADYWLPRLRRALEISGTEQIREFPRRCREKTAQLLANPRRWNGYVFVCCFGAGRGLIRWSYHTQRG